MEEHQQCSNVKKILSLGKKKIESCGYDCLLKNDIGIQHEFSNQKQSGEYNTYFSKLVLLMKIVFEYKVVHLTGYKKWKRKHGLYLKQQEHFGFDILSDINDNDWFWKDAEKYYIDFWNILIHPVLKSLEKSELFMQNVIGRDRQEIGSEVYCKEWKIFLEYAWIDQKAKSVINTLLHDGKKVILYDRSIIPGAAVQDWLNKNGIAENVLITKTLQYSQLTEKEVYMSTLFSVKRSRIKQKLNNIFYVVPPRCNLQRESFFYNPVSCAYDSIINKKFVYDSENIKFNQFYRLGYEYGGILVAGICQWINELIQLKDIEMVAFLSRDCAVVQQVYNRWFRKKANEYLYVSRKALSEVFFDAFPGDYVKNVFYPLIDRDTVGMTVEKAFSYLEIEFLVSRLKEINIKKEERLTYEICFKIEKLIEQHFEELKNYFERRKKAAYKYLDEKISQYKKVCVLDLGWNGTSIKYLQYLSSKNVLSCDIHGALIAGMENVNLANNVSLGKISTYLFSNDNKVCLGKERGIPYDEKQIRCFELLFTSSENELNYYELDDSQNTVLCFREENSEKEYISQIHRGIMDFEEDFLPFIQQYDLKIDVEAAFEPFSFFLENKKLVKKLISEL